MSKVHLLKGEVLQEGLRRGTYRNRSRLLGVREVVGRRCEGEDVLVVLDEGVERGMRDGLSRRDSQSRTRMRGDERMDLELRRMGLV